MATVRNTISNTTIRKSSVADQTAMSVVILCDRMTQFSGIYPLSTTQNVGFLGALCYVSYSLSLAKVMNG